MSEMNHVKVAKNLERLANDFEEVGTPGNAKILRSAAADERRIASGELVEVVHAHYIHFSEYETKRCSHCGIVFGDSLYEKYCPSCGSLMDEVRTGKSLSGKDDNHATN